MPELTSPRSPEVPLGQRETEPVSPDTRAEHARPIERAGEHPSTVPPAAAQAITLPMPAAGAMSPAILERQVESVLSEGLLATYRDLDPATKIRFKQVGETTARTISGLLRETKVQVEKIIDLLISWLRIIPGVNAFFLEQEAKIKADKLLALRQPPRS